MLRQLAHFTLIKVVYKFVLPLFHDRSFRKASKKLRLFLTDVGIRRKSMDALNMVCGLKALTGVMSLMLRVL